jgi:tubulin--tyrosine ligase
MSIMFDVSSCCFLSGHSITLFDSHTAVLDFIDSQTEGSISWVVQRYIDNPILIPAGKRKFDIRIWVLLDAEYNIHVYRRGALRVASQSYVCTDESGGDSGVMDLSDIHAHLSNHCIAETHPDYGKYEPTNELWYDQFEEILLEMTGGEVSFARDLMPQIHDIIRHSLLAVKDRLQGSESSGGYNSFNVFGYDFMLSKEWDSEKGKENIKVWLIEINSSPAVAEDLLEDFVEDLLEVVVDPFYQPDDDDIVSESKRENVTETQCKPRLAASELFGRGFDTV